MPSTMSPAQEPQLLHRGFSGAASAELLRCSVQALRCPSITSTPWRSYRSCTTCLLMR